VWHNSDVGSRADYGNLESVVLGVVENYTPHLWAWKAEGASSSDFEKACDLARDAIPNQIRNEVGEDLEEFSQNLSKLGIEVIRPQRAMYENVIENSAYYAWGNDFYNMRDLHIVFSDQLVVASPCCPPRVEETRRLSSFFSEICKRFNLNLVKSPSPKLKMNPQEEFYLEGGLLTPIENHKGVKLGGDYPEVWHRLENDEILFDAANIARFENEAIFLVSSTANKAAFEWLSKELGHIYGFTSTDVYRSSHIDSTIVPLAHDTVLVNAARVNSLNLPSALREKKVIYFDQVAEIPEAERQFHKQRKIIAEKINKLGVKSNLDEMSSPWAGLNVLSIKDNLIAVESRQQKLMRELENQGFEVLSVRYRHPYTFLGGLHCTTLDIKRT
jgi:N-dimethylarginine dimethylaminohydrolase